MSTLDEHHRRLFEWFEALESEYAEMPPLPPPSWRARLRGRIYDIRAGLAHWIDPYS